MSFDPLEYLRHILAEADYLIENNHGLAKEEFLGNETLRRAYARSLEVIGEASKMVPQDLRDKYPALEWRSMAGMRDRLIHAYFGVDYDLVWNVVQQKVPALRNQVREILRSARGSGGLGGRSDDPRKM